MARSPQPAGHRYSGLDPGCRHHRRDQRIVDAAVRAMADDRREGDAGAVGRQACSGGIRAEFAAGGLRYGEGRAAWYGRDQRGLSGLAIRLTLSLSDLDQGATAAHLALVQPGAGGRAHGCAGISGEHALVSADARGFPAVALWRLWRPATEDHLGTA